MARSTNRSASSSRPSINKQPQRPHSTAAVPVAQPQQPTIIQAPAGGGMLSNILQTATGVAVGHTVGRMITGLFGGGNSEMVAAASPTSSSASPVQCQADVKRFIDCMSQNHDDIASCQMYLDMMRQCQQQFA